MHQENNSESLPQARKYLFVGGENRMHPIMESGECYIEIPDRRFSWKEGDGTIDLSTGKEDRPIPGWDVEGIAQLSVQMVSTVKPIQDLVLEVADPITKEFKEIKAHTTNEEGILVPDKDNRPTGEMYCVIWACNSQKLRLITELQVKELAQGEIAAHRATLARESGVTQGPVGGGAQYREVVANLKRLQSTLPRDAAETVMNMIEKAARDKRIEALRRRQEKQAKAPRPKWGDDERRLYDQKILELMAEKMSARQIAVKVLEWANGNAHLKNFKIPHERTIAQHWVPQLRGRKKRKKAQ